MNRWLHTTRFTRGKLPHWEVLGGRYFVTVRCADSLPATVTGRLQEIHEALRLIAPASREFAAMQRNYFRLMEKHLDAGKGECLLREPDAASSVIEEFHLLAEWQIDVRHYSVMPNHWHVMIEPQPGCSHSLGEIMRRVKGRTARAINASSGRTGPFWQSEWFDRWMRTDAEYEKCVSYIQNNPVKAGLAAQAGDHPWTK